MHAKRRAGYLLPGVDLAAGPRPLGEVVLTESHNLVVGSQVAGGRGRPVRLGVGAIGRPVQSFEDGSVIRCGSIDAVVVVARIVAAMAARGVDLGPGDGEYLAGLPRAGGTGWVTLGACVKLPDDPVTCPADIDA